MTLKALVFLLSVSLMCYKARATNQFNTNDQAESSTRCLKTFKEIEQELSSNVPPIEGFLDSNYHNITMALFPGVNLPSLYIKVTIQFVNDTGNNTTKTISDKKPLKFTWSESCTFVYTKDIGLTAMSFYSLGTVSPQRRQRELVITVPPLCNNSIRDEKKIWIDVLIKLQDIAIMPNLSDPRVNTAMCVVSGHEGDPKDPIDYPSAWYKSCWWKFAASLVTSTFSYWAMYVFTEDMWKLTNFCHESKGYKFRSILLTIVLTTIISFVITCVTFIQNDKHAYVRATFAFIFIFFLINILVNCLTKLKCTCQTLPPCKTCNCFYRCFYSFAGVLMFPCVFLMIHHLIWILCGGIIADPSWAIPVLLSEGIIFCALAYAILIYQGDSDKIGKGSIFWHLVFGVVSIILIIVTVVMSSYGQIVIIPTTGIIEIIAVAMIVWFFKNTEFGLSGLFNGTTSGEKKDKKIINNDPEIKQLLEILIKYFGNTSDQTSANNSSTATMQELKPLVSTA